jgi:hypothetical protein
MDSYEGQRIYNAPQNLAMEDERIPTLSNEEVIKTFKLFIREHQIGNVYIYR